LVLVRWGGPGSRAPAGCRPDLGLQCRGSGEALFVAQPLDERQFQLLAVQRPAEVQEWASTRTAAVARVERGRVPMLTTAGWRLRRPGGHGPRRRRSEATPSPRRPGSPSGSPVSRPTRRPGTTVPGQGVGAAEQARGRGAITGADGLADARAADHLAVHGDAGDGVGGEGQFGPKRSSNATLPLRRYPKWNSSPTKTLVRGWKSRASARTEDLAGLLAERPVKRMTQAAADPDPRWPANAGPETGSMVACARAPPGRLDGDRSDNQRGPSAAMPFLDHAADDLLVPAVNAVEHADGNVTG